MIEYEHFFCEVVDINAFFHHVQQGIALFIFFDKQRYRQRIFFRVSLQRNFSKTKIGCTEYAHFLVHHYPEVAALVFIYFVYYIAGKRFGIARFIAKGEELITIVSLQAVPGSEPYKSAFILYYIIDNIRSKAVERVEMGKYILLCLRRLCSCGLCRLCEGRNHNQ